MSNSVFRSLILKFFQGLSLVQGQLLSHCIIQEEVQPGKSTAKQNNLALDLLLLLGLVSLSDHDLNYGKMWPAP